MNSSVRTFTTAAALLLTAVGTLGVATPAAAEHRYAAARSYAAPALRIERFDMRDEGSFRPGNELRFRLVGTPGVNAYFQIPGELTLASMDEVRPGVYVGSYVIRRGDNPEHFFRANGILKSGSHNVSARLGNSGVEDRDYAYRDRPERHAAPNRYYGDRGWADNTYRRY
jgi:hypothetical protein